MGSAHMLRTTGSPDAKTSLNTLKVT